MRTKPLDTNAECRDDDLQLFDLAETARRLSLSKRMVQKLHYEGKLKGVHCGRPAIVPGH